MTFDIKLHSLEDCSVSVFEICSLLDSAANLLFRAEADCDLVLIVVWCNRLLERGIVKQSL